MRRRMSLAAALFFVLLATLYPAIPVSAAGELIPDFPVSSSISGRTTVSSLLPAAPVPTLTVVTREPDPAGPGNTWYIIGGGAALIIVLAGLAAALLRRRPKVSAAAKVITTQPAKIHVPPYDGEVTAGSGAGERTAGLSPEELTLPLNSLGGDLLKLRAVATGAPGAPLITHNLTLPHRGEVTIGRNQDNQLRLDDPSVPKYHAAITVSPEGLFLRDLGSTNGTYLNENLVLSDSQIMSGDRLKLGNTILQLFIEL